MKNESWKEFHEYDVKWSGRPLKTNEDRAIFCKELLKTIPLGRDPLSKQIREEAEYWITFEEKMRPRLIETGARALTKLILDPHSR